MLAARAGHHCSCPDCLAPTSGPKLEPDGAVTAGNAAHITAASPGGARYDASLSSDERRHYNNGIWLCVMHARIVDQDESRYTAELLHKWKEEAEELAKQKLGKSREADRKASEAAMKFSYHARSLVEALSHESHSGGVYDQLDGLARAAECLGIAVPIEIATSPYPEGVAPHNPFLQECWEGRCTIRFPEGSEESERAAHSFGIDLLVQSRQSAIVALNQWLLFIEHFA